MNTPQDPAVMERGRRRKFVRLGVVALLLLAIGYFVVPRLLFGSLAGIQATDSMTLYSMYSIDAGDYEPGQEPPPTEMFHDCPVMGKVEIKDPRARAEILFATKMAVARSEWWLVKHCYWPRHGIRAISNGKTVDLEICFQCNRVGVYSGNDSDYEPISDVARPLLDRYLKEAGVPQVPEKAKAD